MRRIAPCLAAVMFAGITASASHAQQTSPEDELIGEWTLPESGTVIRTYRCEDAICGQIVKVPDPSRRDSYNPDPVLRRRPLLGLVITSDLYQTGAATWQGKLYNTLNGYSYSGTLKLIDRNRFTFAGCLIGVLFCHTRTYYRVEPPPPPSAAKRQKPPPRAVSANRSPAAKAKPARKAPTQADFEEFLKARAKSDSPTLTDQERQILFRDFQAWRQKR